MKDLRQPASRGTSSDGVQLVFSRLVHLVLASDLARRLDLASDSDAIPFGAGTAR